MHFIFSQLQFTYQYLKSEHLPGNPLKHLSTTIWGWVIRHHPLRSRLTNGSVIKDELLVTRQHDSLRKPKSKWVISVRKTVNFSVNYLNAAKLPGWRMLYLINGLNNTGIIIILRRCSSRNCYRCVLRNFLKFLPPDISQLWNERCLMPVQMNKNDLLIMKVKWAGLIIKPKFSVSQNLDLFVSCISVINLLFSMSGFCFSRLFLPVW